MTVAKKPALNNPSNPDTVYGNRPPPQDAKKKIMSDTPTPYTPLFDPDTLLKRLNGDLEIALELLGVFLEDAPIRLAELAKAAQNGDPQKAGKAAHSLKGVCATVAAQPAADLALKLQIAGRESDAAGVKSLLPDFETLLGDSLAAVADYISRNAPKS